MTPVMYALGGLKGDSIQETHPWHVQNINPELIDASQAVCLNGSKEAIAVRGLFLFHAPVIGGWKNYAVLTAEAGFHIGWISRLMKTGTVTQAAVHKLPIQTDTIRMLIGPPDYQTTFLPSNRMVDKYP